MGTATTQEQPIRVLVVDDHLLVRIGLTYALTTQPNLEVVGEASNGAGALRVYRECRPDVVILDLRMPGEGGLATIAALRREFGDVRILVLTNYGSGDEIEEAIKAGAKGFLAKDTPLEELMVAIRDVRAGRQHLSGVVSARLANKISSQLSERELEVLKLIAKGRNNKQIGEALHVTEATVKGHISKVLVKLGVVDRTQALLAGVKRGLLHID